MMCVSHAFMTVSSNLATWNDDQIFFWIDEGNQCLVPAARHVSRRAKSLLPYQPLMDFVDLVTVLEQSGKWTLF